MGIKDRLIHLFSSKSEMPYKAKPGQASTYTDPVCGMKVDPNSPLQFDYQGVHYLFCAESCLNRFRSNPTQFIRQRAAS